MARRPVVKTCMYRTSRLERWAREMQGTLSRDGCLPRLEMPVKPSPSRTTTIPFFRVLVLWSRALPLKDPVFSKDCGDAHGVFAHYHTPWRRRHKLRRQPPNLGLALETPLWASALIPTTPPNLPPLPASEGHTIPT